MNRYAATLMLLSCTILLVITTLSPFSESWGSATLLSQSYVVAAVTSFLAMILDNRKGGVSYMFEFFMLFFIAVPAMLQIDARLFPWFASLQPRYISGAYGIIALSHLSFHGGWLFRVRRRPRNAPIWNADAQLGDMRFYTKWAWGFALIATLFAVAAGPSNLFVARFDRGDVGFQGLTQQLLFMSRSLSLLAMIMLFFLARQRLGLGLRRQNIFVIMLFLPAFLIINYLPALPRFILFGILLAISTIFFDFFRTRTKAFVTFASVLTLFIVFPVIKSLGAGELNWEGFSARADLSMLGAYLLRVDFDAFMQITSTVEYMVSDVGPIRYGQNFAGVALFFVPRAIWPNKPLDTGEIVSTNLGYIYTNVSSPLPAEAMMGFGYLGPVIVFFILARFIAGIEEQVKDEPGTRPRFAALFLYAISMGFIVIVMRGALNGVAPQFATAFLAVFIMQFFKSHKVVFSRRSSA